LDRSKSNLRGIGAACLFANGLIFIFYALSVPTFVRGIHWLITVAAIFFIVALSGLYNYLSQAYKSAALGVAVLFGGGMGLIVLSDVLLVSSLIPRFTHDLIYVFGNGLFVISLFVIGVVSWRENFPRWVSILSLVTGIVGVFTYVPGAVLLLVPSLLLVGVWSLVMGFTLRRKQGRLKRRTK
jgi:hypothetical protein